MKLYAASVAYHAPAHRKHLQMLGDVGACNLLFTYGWQETRKGALAFVQEGVSVVEVPDHVGKAFLESGLPHTVAALRQFLLDFKSKL